MAERGSAERLRAHGGMLLWALLVGLSFPSVGLLGSDLPPLWLTALRFAIAALAFLPFLGRRIDWPRARGAGLYLAMGAALGAFFAIMFWAAHRVSSLSMAVLFVSVPLLAYGLGRGFGVERPAPALLGCLLLGALGALGLAWAESRESGQALQPGQGELLFFVGCLCSALYPVLSKWGLERGWLHTRAIPRAFWSLCLGALASALLGAVLETPADLLRLGQGEWLVLVYLDILSTSATFWLQQHATRLLTPAGITAYGYLVPFVAMLVAFATRPRLVDWAWLPGSLLVLLAMALLLREDVRAHRSLPKSTE